MSRLLSCSVAGDEGFLLRIHWLLSCSVAGEERFLLRIHWLLSCSVAGDERFLLRIHWLLSCSVAGDERFLLRIHWLLSCSVAEHGDEGLTKQSMKKKTKMIGDSRDKFQPISKSPIMTYLWNLKGSIWLVDRGYANDRQLSSKIMTKYKYNNDWNIY